MPRRDEGMTTWCSTKAAGSTRCAKQEYGIMRVVMLLRPDEGTKSGGHRKQYLDHGGVDVKDKTAIGRQLWV